MTAWSEPIAYRDATIAKVEQPGGRTFGHAGHFANEEFKGRSTEVHDRLRCLAKARVDLWAALASAVRR
ncbi:hypothetical protein [Variovorax saccharolyticus]|uniref:hypothetical protein n=1 Tax=Variovorax saccharolyticus TaxID=3053516 RepID=UPI002575F770|nr:hypothetical protein [Variovorax sp. J22R187]MDM0022881.1 hypothetical protein [Variovorax sp. J22R187]